MSVRFRSDTIAAGISVQQLPASLSIAKAMLFGSRSATSMRTNSSELRPHDVSTHYLIDVLLDGAHESYSVFWALKAIGLLAVITEAQQQSCHALATCQVARCFQIRSVALSRLS